MPFSYLREKVRAWPNGLAWGISEKQTLKSRRRKHELFISLMKPGPEDKILDVGVSPYLGRYTNYLELWYPHKEQITALTNQSRAEFNEFRKTFPEVRLVFSDGKNMSFRDDAFDIVFSNAVVEHVGEEEEQRNFVHELVRVGKTVYLTTPNYWFPLEPHTLIPFAHYLPIPMRFWVYRRLGRGYGADRRELNPLTPRKLLSLFPAGVRVRLFKQRLCGVPASLVAVAQKARIQGGT